MKTTRRKYTNDELTPLISTLDKREKLLDRWRRNHKLGTKQFQAVWLLLHQEVYSREVRHYKSAQTSGKKRLRRREWFDLVDLDNYRESATYLEGQDRHTERILELATFLRRRTDKSVPWCITAYKRRFAQFEAKLEIRRHGLGEPASEQSQVVNDLIKVQQIFRRFPRQSNNEYVIMLMIAFPNRFKRAHQAWDTVLQFATYRDAITPAQLDENTHSEEVR